MALKQYIGARYVTKIYENSLNPLSAEWEADVNYEPLTMVTFNYGSYLSKKDVPATVGNPSDNPAYWTQTGFYNGQIAYLYEAVSNINGHIGDLDLLDTPVKSSIVDAINNVIDLNSSVTPELFGAVGDGVTNDTIALQSAIDTGKPVELKGSYLVNGTLTSSNGITLLGNGKIKRGNTYARTLLNITGGNVLINGIEIDGNDNTAVGIFIDDADIVLINGVNAHDFVNTVDDAYSCVGIHVNESIIASVTNCIVKNVNRVTMLAGVQASNGIHVNSTKISTITGCVVDNIHSSVEYADCDGIAAGYVSSPTNIVIIRDNVISKCTGRFAKAQAMRSDISFNEMDNSELNFTPNRYYQPISIQYGDGVVSHNKVNCGPVIERNYSYIVSCNTPRNKVHYAIKDNEFIGASTGRARGFFTCHLSGSGDCNITFDITNNYIETEHEALIILTAANTVNQPTGEIRIDGNNLAHSYNLIECSINNSIVGIDTFITNNTLKAITGASKVRLSPDLLAFANMVVKNNFGIDYIYNSGVDFDNITMCDLYYYGYGATGKIANVPAAMGDGTRLYLKVDKNNGIAFYCNTSSDSEIKLYTY